MFSRFRFFATCAVPIVTLILLIGCTPKATVDRARLMTIKNVAVVMYTVPTEIKYKSDPKAVNTVSLARIALSAAQQASNGDGKEAATASYKTFVQELNAQSLPFQVMSFETVSGNPGFKALYMPASEEKKESGLLDAAGSLFGGGDSLMGAAPEGFNQYGIAPDAWNMETALMGSDGESEYVKKAIEALGADGVLVIQDTGFCFSCEACVGTADVMTGAASTGSYFIATLFDRSMIPVLTIKEYFLTTDAQAAMVSNIIIPPLHEGLFNAHGKRFGQVFADSFRKAIKEPEANEM